MAFTSEPLFFDSLSELLQTLRLGNIQEVDEAAPIIDQCVIEARIKLLDVLPQSVIDTAAATSATDSPTTLEERVKYHARALERTVVERLLIDSLRYAAMDASGAMQKWMQKESPYRQLSPFQQDAKRKELEEKAESLAARLFDTSITPASESYGDRLVAVAMFTPDDDPPSLGSSIGLGVRL